MTGKKPSSPRCTSIFAPPPSPQKLPDPANCQRRQTWRCWRNIETNPTSHPTDNIITANALGFELLGSYDCSIPSVTATCENLCTNYNNAMKCAMDACNSDHLFPKGTIIDGCNTFNDYFMLNRHLVDSSCTCSGYYYPFEVNCANTFPDCPSEEVGFWSPDPLGTGWYILFILGFVVQLIFCCRRFIKKNRKELSERLLG